MATEYVFQESLFKNIFFFCAVSNIQHIWVCLSCRGMWLGGLISRIYCYKWLNLSGIELRLGLRLGRYFFVYSTVNQSY